MLRPGRPPSCSQAASPATSSQPGNPKPSPGKLGPTRRAQRDNKHWTRLPRISTAPLVTTWPGTSLQSHPLGHKSKPKKIFTSLLRPVLVQGTQPKRGLGYKVSSEQAASGTVDPGPGPQGWADPVERVLLCVAPPGGCPQARLSHQNGHGGSRLHVRAGQPQGEQATAKKMGKHAITLHLKTEEGTGGRHQRTPLGQKKSPNGLRRRAPSPPRAPAGRCPEK